MKKFSRSWKSSKKRKKQRKYRYNAPLHIRQRFVSAHLSKQLRAKYKKRNIPVKKGDTVAIMRGKFKKHSGKVENVNLKMSKVFISGIEATRKDGTKSRVALEPSNLMITELNLDDKKRAKKLGVV